MNSETVVIWTVISKVSVSIMFFSTTDKHTTKSLQGIYYIIGATSWDKTEIINRVLQVEKMQTFLVIKLTPQD